jgi:hypothetical protein
MAPHMLKEKSLNPNTFEVLRKMKPMRQIEAAELMISAGNYTASYAKSCSRSQIDQLGLADENHNLWISSTPTRLLRFGSCQLRS